MDKTKEQFIKLLQRYASSRNADTVVTVKGLKKAGFKQKETKSGEVCYQLKIGKGIYLRAGGIQEGRVSFMQLYIKEVDYYFGYISFL